LKQKLIGAPKQGVISIKFSPDGTLLIGTTIDGPIIIWNLASGKIKTILIGHQGATVNVAFYRSKEKHLFVLHK